jgi:ApaG protein
MSTQAAESSSEATTEGVHIHVSARYSGEHSSPLTNHWFFLYTIRITNEGSARVQLLSRHWLITDATGELREVQGEGVVGKQPVLEPGEAFEYTSGCPLETPFGNMEGTYEMVREDGSRFEARIARFELSEPISLH